MDKYQFLYISCALPMKMSSGKLLELVYFLLPAEENYQMEKNMGAKPRAFGLQSNIYAFFP